MNLYKIFSNCFTPIALPETTWGQTCNFRIKRRRHWSPNYRSLLCNLKISSLKCSLKIIKHGTIKPIHKTEFKKHHNNIIKDDSYSWLQNWSSFRNCLSLDLKWFQSESCWYRISRIIPSYREGCRSQGSFTKMNPTVPAVCSTTYWRMKNIFV